MKSIIAHGKLTRGQRRLVDDAKQLIRDGLRNYSSGLSARRENWHLNAANYFSYSVFNFYNAARKFDKLASKRFVNKSVREDALKAVTRLDRLSKQASHKLDWHNTP